MADEMWQTHPSTLKTAMSASRILRFVLTVVVVLALAFAAAVAALFYRLDANAVRRTVVELADKALSAQVDFEGKIEVKRFTTLEVTLPAMRFTTKDEEARPLGRIEGAQASVSLWGLALGAVQVQQATLLSPSFALTVPELSGNALFDHTFGAVRFPDDLRINTLAVKDARINLTVTSQQKTFAYRLSDVYLTLGRVSPEMTAPFELSARYTPMPVTAAVEPAPGAQEPSAEQSTAPEASAEPSPTTAPETAPAQEAAQPASDNAASQSPASENTAPVQENVPPAQESPAQQGAPAPQPSNDDSQAFKPLSALLGVREAHAAVPELFNWRFDPGKNAGIMSAKGNLTVSSEDAVVMLEDLSVSLETRVEDVAYTLVGKADRVRFKGEEVSVNNLSATVSRPEFASGDVTLGAVDFRMRPGIFESPEMRVGYVNEGGERSVRFDVSSSVRALLTQASVQFESLTATLKVSGDATLPQDFEASLSGFINVAKGFESAKVGLSGQFAGAPFSYHGTARWEADSKRPVLRGELMLGEIRTATVPMLKQWDWMQAVDFEGPLRIGKIFWRQLEASQLYGTLAVRDGTAELSNLIVNTADGRITGQARFAQTRDWLLTGTVDGVSVEKVLAGLESPAIVSGVASGPLVVTGRGTDAAALTAESELRVLRGAYHGMDEQAVRNRILGKTPEMPVTGPGLASRFDEASTVVTLNNGNLALRNIQVRSVSLRANARADVSLADATLAGTSSITYSPMHGIPSIHIEAALSGPVAAVEWGFDWAQAQAALQRAQALTAPSGKKNRNTEKSGRSIWQSVKDFFRF